MMKLNIGVIGLGRMGQVYAAHVASHIRNARLIAVADPRQDVAAPFAEQFSDLQIYADYLELLQNSDIQGVIIATPTSTHRDIVIAAAEAGKAIFCEKPTALTLEATDEMLEAVHRAALIPAIPRQSAKLSRGSSASP
jgi:predicted dehydrogenase